MAPSFSFRPLVTRDEEPAQGAAINNKFRSYYIIGIAFAGLLFLGAAVWITIRHFRKRSRFRRERETKIQSLKINVRGIMEDDEEKKSYGIILSSDHYAFSRENMSESPVTPETSVLSPAASKKEIIDHYESEGKLPRPFAPFMAGSGKLAPPPPVNESGSNRSSTASWKSFDRASFFGGISKRSSTASFASSIASSGTKNKRPVRQIFNPVLPDELVVSLGEHLTVMTSYEDGWCIVGRDSIFKPGEIELGAIPAWCFIKPVKGLHAERPLRTSSLGVTVQIDEPTHARQSVMSWSNF